MNRSVSILLILGGFSAVGYGRDTGSGNKVMESGKGSLMSSSVVTGAVLRNDESGVSARLRFVSDSDPAKVYETDTDPYTGAYEIRGVWTEVEDAPGPERFALYGNHPNP
ncbi:MAG TPA: hypothetical protein ENN03_00685, partial [bacterium]|nr:hypothetical protein [bacterium]